MTHHFDINAPIWKNRSVGLNLLNINPGDDITISILYKNKDNKRIYPHLYSISATEASKYPSQHIKGQVELKIVPIKHLKIINNNSKTININQKQTTMLFDNKEIEKIRKENSDRSTGDLRRKIEAGEQVLTQENSRLDKSKTDGAPMIIVDFVKSADYKPITVYWKLSGSGSDIHKGRVVAHLEQAFQYVLQPCKDENDLLTQMKRFDGKKCKVAVRHKDSLYDTNKGETVVATKAEYWYSGNINDKEFSVDVAKVKVPLDEKDIKRFNDITTLTGKAPRRADESTENQEKTSPVAEATKNNGKKQQDATIAETTQSQEDDGLPF
jgi:hypothetical protein